MEIEIPGTDIKKGLDIYEDDLGIYLSVLRSCASHTPAVIDKLRKVSAETLTDYLAALHSVKGTFATIGAEEIRKEAMQLEQIAKKGDLAGLQAGNDAFLKRVDTLMDNIRSWLKQHDV